jgi:hypothetical protein
LWDAAGDSELDWLISACSLHLLAKNYLAAGVNGAEMMLTLEIRRVQVGLCGMIELAVDVFPDSLALAGAVYYVCVHT